LKSRQKAGKPIIYVDKSGFAHEDLLPKAPGKCLIVMDNASFHKRDDIEQAILDARHILEYLPAYSPELNPIEHTWAQAKSIRRRCHCSVDEAFQEGRL
jgi:transposase